MTALTAPRNTPQRQLDKVADPVAAATKIQAGGIVCLDASGNAVPGSTSAALKSRGVAFRSVDNSGGAAGDETVESQKGCFYFGNSATDAIDRADIGGTAYIEDDQTVAASNGDTGSGATRSAAGKIVDVDANGVWVKFD